MQFSIPTFPNEIYVQKPPTWRAITIKKYILGSRFDLLNVPFYLILPLVIRPNEFSASCSKPHIYVGSIIEYIQANNKITINVTCISNLLAIHTAL
jgi:hypothetical protein